MRDPQFIQVTTTTASREEALKIADSLLAQRLAACVQVSGLIESRYWWNQKLESSQEWICVVKTSRELYSKVEQSIRDCHSYEVPEIVAVPIVDISSSYQQWLESQLATD